MGDKGQGLGASAAQTGPAPFGLSQSSLSQAEPLVPSAAWWRCLHCGCDEYEEHVFTGHMKGVPMVHCANCKALHNAPDPNSKAALRWQISELAEALIDWRNTYLCPCSDLEECATRLLEATDAALAGAGVDPLASGMSASGQDAKRLEAKPASPTAEGGDAHPIPCDPTTPKQEGPNV